MKAAQCQRNSHYGDEQNLLIEEDVLGILDLNQMKKTKLMNNQVLQHNTKTNCKVVQDAQIGCWNISET